MKELTRAINDHLASEFQASHTYLAMSIWLREKDLVGFSAYMLTKSNEERGHASRMIAYLVDSDQEVELPSGIGALFRPYSITCMSLKRV